MKYFSGRILFPWLVLAGICVIHVAVVWHLHPTNFFGMSGDDAIYFSSAKSLAEGHGYVLPNLAGSPPATKYPILYPWLLSWIWRVNPAFPGNLSTAAAFNMVFGVVYLCMMFLFLRTLKSFTNGAALIVTAFCALHPYILGLSANLLADIPFAALVLASFVLADKSLKKNPGLRSAAGCGIVSGLGVLLKVLGLPAAAGLFLAFAVRGGWRKSMAFAAGTLPFVLTLLWRSILAAPSSAPALATSCARSWQLSWVYYMNYQTFWKSSAIESHMFWNYLKTNINFLVYQLGAYFIDLRQVGVTPATIIVFALVCLAVIRGLVRQIQLGGWRPVHFALAVYLIPVLIWDFPSPERFLVPFLTLFAAAIWLEVSHLTEQMRVSFRKSPPVRAWLSTALCVGAIAIALYIAGNSWEQGLRAVEDLSHYRAMLLSDKREGYQWLRDNAPPNARVIAYEEATMFLYTSRQGMSPTILSPAGKIDTQLLDSQLSCLLATAEPIGASYWLSSEDDFKLEWETATIRERSRASELEKSYQQLFRSSQGRVRVYTLAGQRSVAVPEMK